MPSIAIRQLTPHPAQMRTQYDLEALAALTLQIYERGLNAWQPILAAGNGADAGTNGQTAESLHIISGHRRQMAQLLAYALKEWAEAHPETDITVEVARTMLDTLVDSLGSLEKVIASLLVKHGEREVAYVPFEGNKKAEILSLQAANFGGETPDMLGITHSFGQAVAAGATPEEIAPQCGPVDPLRSQPSGPDQNLAGVGGAHRCRRAARGGGRRRRRSTRSKAGRPHYLHPGQSLHRR